MNISSHTARAQAFERPRLLAPYLSGITDLPSILLLNAPAGFGKSALATQLVAAVATQQTRVHKVQCPPESQASLWEAIRAQLPNDDPRMAPYQLLSAREWVARYSALITTPELLVLHDYHHVSSAETDMALHGFAERYPQLRIVALARNVRLLNGPLCARTVRTIGAHELAFNATEQKDFASHFSDGTQKHITDALLLTEGWPQAVHAVLNSSQTPDESNPGTTRAKNGKPPQSFHPGLTRLALDSLELLSSEAREIIFAASLTTTLSFDQAATLIGRSANETQRFIDELIELGLLRRTQLAHGVIFRAHPAVQSTVATVAVQHFSDDKREEIIFGSAREREPHDPISSLRMYLSTSHFDQAEQTLAAHFTRITDDPAACAIMLAPLNDSELREYPTFAAARLMLDFADSTVPYDALRRTLELMRAGATKQLSRSANLSPAKQLAYQLQTMIGLRIIGDVGAAYKIAQQLESIGPVGTAAQHPHEPTGEWAQPLHLSEIGFTAFIAGDYALAQRVWSRLEALLRPRLTNGFVAPLSPSTIRHDAWLQAALHGLSICAANNGNFVEASQTLARADAIREQTGEVAPLLAWVNGEVTRAHLSYQDQNEADLHLATDRVAPWNDRIEQWSMLLQAEAETTRYLRGAGWALSHLETSVAHVREDRRKLGIWTAYLSLYKTMLNTVAGNFVASGQLLSKFPDTNAFVRIEKARLALYSEHWARALVLVQQTGAAGLNQRQLIDRFLIASIAAWKCSMNDEAFEMLRQADARLRACNLSMMLRCVPYEALKGVAEAAKRAQICDITEMVDQVPAPARGESREQLTRKEQLTLEMMLTHPTLAEAADELSLSTATVKSHRLAVYRKLRVSSRDEAIVQATRIGLLSVEQVTDRPQ